MLVYFILVIIKYHISLFINKFVIKPIVPLVPIPVKQLVILKA
jgi:hypothetical protein